MDGNALPQFTAEFIVLTLHPQSEKENPEVIDDWPLHPAADINTSLSVGACWHGKKCSWKSNPYIALHFNELQCNCIALH
jgi:hypothetical protein